MQRPPETNQPRAEARLLLDRERVRLGLEPDDLIGYDTQAAGHLQIASAVAAGLAARPSVRQPTRPLSVRGPGRLSHQPHPS